jgi:hypothetical protein
MDPNIHKCPECKRETVEIPALDIKFMSKDGKFRKYADSGIIKLQSCIMTLSKDGWYQVVCRNCGFEGPISREEESAIRLFNELSEPEEK